MTELPISKLTRLADRLLLRTLDGRVEWRETDIGGRFAAVIGDGSVVFDDGDGQGGPPFSLIIQNASGRAIEEVSDLHPDALAAGSSIQILANTLAKLGAAIREQIYQIESTVDSILDALD